MTLLDKLKSLLGLERSKPEQDRDRDVGVTVEREPDADRSGAETESAPEGVGEPAAEAEPGSDAETEAEAEPGTDAGSETAAEPGTDAADESPDAIKGVGPSYADRLAEAGVETVADLAEADAADLAGETDVSESRLERWIERARNR